MQSCSLDGFHYGIFAMTTRRQFIQFSTTACALLGAPAIVRAARPVIRIGLAPQQATAADTKRVWEPIYKWVCDQVGADLHLTVANDWAGVSTALANQQIDVAQLGPWGYVLARARGEARAINMMMIEGKPYYKAIIVARPGLDIKRFPEDAKGLSMQMLDVGSTTGWMVPTHFLKLQKKLDPKTYFGRYAEGASAAAAQMAVASGQVDLATGWDTHRNTMIRNGQLKPDANKVVWESAALPNEPVVVRRGLDDGLAKALQGALTAFPADLAKTLIPWPYSGFTNTSHDAYVELERMGRDLGVLKA